MRRLLTLIWVVLLFAAAPLAAQDAPADSAAEISAEVEDDRGFLTRLLEENLSSAGRQVTITGFRGALSSRATFERITIADAEGVWITLHDGAIQWNRSALLSRRIEIEELSAARIELPRRPVGPETPERRAEARDFSLPELPVGVEIRRIAAGRVEIGAPVIGEAAVVSVNGALSLAGGEGTADLTIERVDSKRGVFAVDAGFSNASRMLKIDLTLDEAADGIFANIIGLEGEPALSATIAGEGPLSDFHADVRLATDGEPRVTGNVTLTREAGADGSLGTGFRVRLGGDVAALVPETQRAFFGSSAQLLAEGWRGEDGRLDLPVLLIDTEGLNISGALATTGAGAPQSAVLLVTLGEEAGATTLPVRLPLRGEATTVRSGRLQLSYDAAQGDGWTLTGNLSDFAQQGFALASVDLDGRGSVTLEGGSIARLGGRVAFDADGIAPADDDIARAIGETLEGGTDFEWTPGNAAELTNLALTGTDYGLAGEARADGLGSGLTVSGRLEGRYADLSRLSGIAGQPLVGQADLSVEGLYTVLSRAFDFDALLSATDLGVGQPQLDRLLGGRSEVRASIRRDETGIELREVSVVAPRLTAVAAGTLGTEASDITATLDMDSLADVDPALAGSLQADAVLSGPAGQRRVALNGRAMDLQTGIDTLDAALRGTTDLVALAGQEDSGWQVRTLRLANPQLTVEGEGSLSPGAMDTSLRLTVPDLAAFDRGWSGALEATGHVEDTPDGRRFTLGGSGEELRLGRADVDGALTGTTRFDVVGVQDGATVTIERADITNDQARISAAGTLGPDGTDIRGDASIAALESLGLGWRGSVELTGRVTEDGEGARRFELDGTGQDIAFGQQQVDGALSGTTRLDVLAVQREGVVTIEAAELVNDQARITATGSIGGGRTDASAHIEVARLESLGIGWRGSLVADGTLLDEGDGARRFTLEGTAQNLALGQAQVDAALAGPTRFALRGAERNGTVTLEEAVIDNPRLAASATGSVGGGATDLTAQLRADSLAFLGQGLRGAVTAQARLLQDGDGMTIGASGQASGLGTGNPTADALLGGTTRFDLAARSAAGDLTISRLEASNPQVTVTASGALSSGVRLDARLASLALLAPRFEGAATATGTVRREGERLVLDLDLGGPGGTTVSVSGTAAQDFSTADLAINGRTDAALINPILRVRSVEGPVDFDLRLSGPPGLEALSGRLSLPDARLSDPKLGVRIEGFQLVADLSGGSAAINASGRMADGGTVSAAGRIGLAEPRPIDLAVSFDGAVLRDPNLYETSISGTVQASGTLAEGPLIAGRLTLGETEIRIPSTGLGGGRDIPDIVHLGERPPSRRTRAKAGLTPFPGAEATEAGLAGPPASPPQVVARLDLTLSAPRAVFIRGRGVDAELGGEIRLTGAANNVVPIGTLELIRGRVDLLGKRFDLTEGRLEMQGSMIPVIHLVAETQQDSITTRIIIDGEARDPQITFESSPEMPQEEVLSQLLFGRGLETISALQAAQLANAVAVLTGTGGAGIVDRLRDQVGLDDLDLATDDQGNVSVRAGKYLSENLYTDVEVNGEGQTRLNLNLDITEEIRARGSVNSEGNSSIGIFFERDY